ncbi:hypothetical protein EDD11_006549 [Mortierella claussenii]|nr:hypothetical protein EDD11_006549 [Mortierella claussenii]
MANAESHEQRTQAFRLCSSSSHGPSLDAEIRVIPARQDSRTGEHIILWRDIQDHFANAERIVNGDRAVLFMTDDNFEYLMPKRIPYHPGVVLDVIVAEAVPVSTPAQAEWVMLSAQGYDALPLDSVLQQVSDLAISDAVVTPSQALRVSSPQHTHSESSTGMQLSSQILSQPREWDIHAILSGQEMQTENIKSAVRYYFDKLHAQVEKNRLLQEQQLLLQQDMNQLQHNMDEENRRWQQEMTKQQEEMGRVFEEKQQEMLRMQEQALERLVIVQDRVQAVLTQTYELHEYPIPHLFIVLPKNTRMRDSFSKPFSNQFRLFFLCECGKHTMTENSTIPHEIHLAKHEGYDIDRPTEFFDKYGPYVLTMMQMVKYGFTVAGMVVPALAHTGLVDRIDAVQSGLDLAKNDLGSLVDDTINFINTQYENADGNMDAVTDQLKLDKLEVLEGADLRQLESYLSVNDLGRVLGNLYRITTVEGKVKWVCMDHYRENYRTSTVQKLRDTVTANKGDFPVQEGTIVISFTSSSMAKQFYDVLIKAKGVQQLDITLAWDATMDDLRKLASAVSNANILSLKLNGKSFKAPNRDLMYNGRRFDPIIQLIQNQRIQALEIHHFADFYAHVSTAALTAAPQLRTLVLGSNFDVHDKEATAFMIKVLQSCPSLAKLTVWALDLFGTYTFLKDKSGHVPALDSMTIVHKDMTIAAKLFKREILGATLITKTKLSTILQDRFLEYRFVTEIITEQIGDIFEENAWYEFMDKNPRLSRIQIGCQSRQAPSLINMITAVRQKIVTERRVSVLERLELTTGNETFLSVDFSLDAALFTYSISLETSKFPRHAPLDPLGQLLNQHGAFVERLVVDEEYTDDHAFLFDSVTKDQGSKLVSLTLKPDALTSAGWDCMDRIITRSHNLKRLAVEFYNLNKDKVQDLAERLLVRQSTRLNHLRLDGSAAHMWFPRLYKAVQTRKDLPVLDSFEINCHEKLQSPPAIIEWITALVSSHAGAPETGSKSSAETVSISETMTVAKAPSVSWTPLERVSLEGIHLESREWKSAIKALDFGSLEELVIRDCNFDVDELYVLANALPENSKTKPTPLTSLKLGMTGLDSYGSGEVDMPTELHSALRRKAPLVKVSK